MTRPKLRSDRRPVVIGTESAAVIREIGPIAWVVLVHIHGSPTAGTRSVTASARTLATELGLSKDTCARALRTLRTADLIGIDTARTELGRFGTVRYRLIAPSRLISTRMDHPSDPIPPEPRPSNPQIAPAQPKSRMPSQPEQLAFLAFDERT